MTKAAQNGWITRSIEFLLHRRNTGDKKHITCHGRKLRLENLEDRMLLAVLPPATSADGQALIAQGYCDSNMEYPSSKILVTTFEDVVNKDDGLISLREAIKYVESGSTVLFGQSGTIEIDPNLGNLSVNKSISFDAGRTGTITLDAGLSGRIMEIAPSKGLIEVGINNFRFTQGKAGSGGALWIGVDATVILTECQMVDNTASQGGAVYLYSTGKLIADQTVWQQNKANRGGAIYVGTTAVFESDACTFNNNSASEAGGALYSESSLPNARSVYVANTHFELNTLTATTTSSESGGGACMLVAGDVQFSNCEFLYNSSATRNGGAICCGTSLPEVDFFDSYFEANTASNGGAVSISAGAYVRFDQAEFQDNKASWNGGAIHSMGSSSVESSSILYNTVESDDGGGIFNTGYMVVSGSVILGNICMDPMGSGAGIRNGDGQGKGDLFIVDTLISDNVSGTTGVGGGIRNVGGTISAVNSTVANNTAYSSGGGIDNSGTVTLLSSIVANNEVLGSAGVGGGIYLETGSTTTVKKSTIYGNIATQDGGGVYTKGEISFIESTVTANQDDNLNAQTSGLYEGLTPEDENYKAPNYDNKNATLYDNITAVVPKDEAVSLVIYDAWGNVIEGAIDFAIEAVDSASYSETFQIWNEGTETVTLETPSITGLNLSNFSWDLSSTTVAPGQYISLTITFSPDTTGVSVLDLNFIANEKSQFSLLVGGTVVQPTATVTPQSSSLISVNAESMTYSVVLNTQPVVDTKIELIVPNGLFCDKSVLTFTADNWQTPQIVKVTTIPDYFANHQVNSLAVYHRIVPSFNEIFANKFDPEASLYVQTIDSIEISVIPYVAVQEGTTISVPPGHEEVARHIPASFVTTSREIPGYDGLLIFSVNSSNPAHKTVSSWKISWGDNTYQTVSYLSNRMEFSHWYSQSGSYNISVLIEYSDGTAENDWYTIARHEVSFVSSAAAQRTSDVEAMAITAAVDTVMETEENPTQLPQDVPDEDAIVILSSAALSNTRGATNIRLTRSVYFSQLRHDSIFDGNLNLKKKRILS